MKYAKDYYQILGVNPNATAAEVRRAYRRLAILYHPDRNPTPQSNAQMQEINEAYGVLGNHNKRAKYDFQHRNIFTESPTTNPYSYDQKRTSSQYPFVWGGILSSSFFVFLIAMMILLRARTIFTNQHMETPMAETPVDDLMFFGEESTFIANNSTIGPIDAPFSSGLSSVIIEKYGFTISPGPGASAIGVGNVIQNSLPSDLFVEGRSYSNLNFWFAKYITGFGFAVESATCDDYSGVSNFAATLKQDHITVGIVRFSTPADGVVFVAFVSKAPFNTIILTEVDGGPENQDQFGGCADRESFGKFYIVSYP